jgi:GDP-D-mannose 3',5'-epimerase
MGFIHSAETEIMRNSMLVNLNVIEQAARSGVKKYFLASSVCVYRDMKIGEGELSETDAYPANPDNEYGWEKLYAERAVLAYGREFGISTRIARFQNCYGPEGTWIGGREKAPAALCRKVAESTNGQIEAWGDGTAVRSFIYVDDLVAGIRKLMESDIQEPTNIGTREYVSVQELVQIVANVANKQIKPQWINGPVGVQSRNFSNDLIESTGFKPIYSLAAGLALTYPWIEEQLLAFNS